MSQFFEDLAGRIRHQRNMPNFNLLRINNPLTNIPNIIIENYSTSNNIENYGISNDMPIFRRIDLGPLYRIPEFEKIKIRTDEMIQKIFEDTTKTEECEICAVVKPMKKFKNCTHEYCEECIISWFKKHKDNSSCFACRTNVFN